MITSFGVKASVKNYICLSNCADFLATSFLLTQLSNYLKPRFDVPVGRGASQPFYPILMGKQDRDEFKTLKPIHMEGEERGKKESIDPKIDFDEHKTFEYNTNDFVFLE